MNTIKSFLLLLALSVSAISAPIASMKWEITPEQSPVPMSLVTLDLHAVYSGPTSVGLNVPWGGYVYSYYPTNLMATYDLINGIYDPMTGTKISSYQTTNGPTYISIDYPACVQNPARAQYDTNQMVLDWLAYTLVFTVQFTDGNIKIQTDYLKLPYAIAYGDWSLSAYVDTNLETISTSVVRVDAGVLNFADLINSGYKSPLMEWAQDPRDPDQMIERLTITGQKAFGKVLIESFPGFEVNGAWKPEQPINLDQYGNGSLLPDLYDQAGERMMQRYYRGFWDKSSY